MNEEQPPPFSGGVIVSRQPRKRGADAIEEGQGQMGRASRWNTVKAEPALTSKGPETTDDEEHQQKTATVKRVKPNEALGALGEYESDDDDEEDAEGELGQDEGAREDGIYQTAESGVRVSLPSHQHMTWHHGTDICKQWHAPTAASRPKPDLQHRLPYASRGRSRCQPRRPQRAPREIHLGPRTL